MAVSDALIGGLLGGGIAGALINALHQRGEAFRQRRYTAAEAYLSHMDDARAALKELLVIVDAARLTDRETRDEALSSSEIFRTDKQKAGVRRRDDEVRRSAEVLLEGKPLEDRCNELESLARRHLRQAQVKESRLSLLFSGGTRVLGSAMSLTYYLQGLHTTLQMEMQRAQHETQGAEWSYEAWEGLLRAKEQLEEATKWRVRFASYTRRVVNSSALWATAANSAQAFTPYRWWQNQRERRALKGTWLSREGGEL